MNRKAALCILGATGLLLLACGLLPSPPWLGQHEATAWVLPTVTPGAAHAPAATHPVTPTANPNPTVSITPITLVPITLVPTPTTPPTLSADQGGPVVLPPDLSANQALLPPLQTWEIWLQPGSHVEGHNYVTWIEDPDYGQILTMVREFGDKDGGGAGVVFAAPLDVTGYQHLYAAIRARVVHEYGGNIANVNPRWFPEGAVQIRIQYLDAFGQKREWFHGFYVVASGSRPDSEHFTQVMEDDWFVWSSADLMSLPHPPARITEVKVYGFGWAFQGDVAGFNLFGAPKP